MKLMDTLSIQPMTPNTPFIDIHAHLDLCEDVASVVERAKAAGVKHIVTNGIDPVTNRKCLEISKQFDEVMCGMGVYPRAAMKREAQEMEEAEFTDYSVADEVTFIASHKDDIVAISEVGMDFVPGETEEQYEDFRAMISLAKKLDKPLVVHSRKAELQCIETLESENAKNVVMHCFCGKKKLVQRIADNGWSCSVPATVVKTQQFQNMVEMMPLTQLFCETDTPFLSPFPEGKNEPAFVVESYKKIAEIKKLTPEETAQAIYMNWQRMFL